MFVVCLCVICCVRMSSMGYYVSLVVCVLLFFFFFRKKTAYEMRISDWSSDVCSSDLDGISRARPRGSRCRCRSSSAARATPAQSFRTVRSARRSGDRAGAARRRRAVRGRRDYSRSEEHTSELQSLMRISYAVFCLKKKNYIYTFNFIIYFNNHTNLIPILP